MGKHINKDFFLRMDKVHKMYSASSIMHGYFGA